MTNSPWRRVLLPAALILGPFIALLDLSIVNVALPAMRTGLGTDTAGLQWVVDGYTLVLAALMLSGGSLGDRIGRRRAYLIGLLVFAAGSAVCAAAPVLGVLVAGRLVQGTGSALLVPGALSLLSQAYQDPARRARMLGIWGLFGSASTAVGPVAGGLLVDRFGWPSIFVVNLPICALAYVLARRVLPESADPRHAALDPLGQVLGIGWLAALCYGLIEGRAYGWTSAATLLALTLAGLGFAAFVLVEARARRPMLPVRMFADARFATVIGGSLVFGFATNGVFFLLSLYLQEIHGFAPGPAGVRLVPLTLAIMAVSPFAGRLAARYGPLPVVCAGYLVTGTSLVLMTTFRASSGTVPVSAVIMLMGAGMALSIGPAAAAALGGVPRERSGIASALVNAARQTGTAVGVAVLGLLLESGPSPVRGLHVAVLVAGASILAMGTLVFAVLSRPRREGTDAPPTPSRDARPASDARPAGDTRPAGDARPAADPHAPVREA